MSSKKAAIEQSPYKSAVIYYDYEGEYNRANPNMGWYIRFMHDSSAVPRGKRSVRVLRVPNGPPTCNTTKSVPDDPGDLKAQVSINPPQGGRHLDYVDFHSYRLNNPPVNPNIECSHEYIRALFPDSTVLIGESGAAPSPLPSNEATQQSTVLNLAQRAQTKGIPYFLIWMLWDNTPGSPPAGLALGYSFHSPKDVLGGISSLLNILRNPDMELGNGAVLSNWFSGGSVWVSLSRLFSNANAATNNYYSRLQINGSGTGWVVSSLTPVKGGEPLYVNGYIRANSTMHDVSIIVVHYNALGAQTSSVGPAFTPWEFSWTWNNYLQRVGSWSVPLNNDTVNVIIQVFGTNSSGTGLIDFDTFSVWQRP